MRFCFRRCLSKAIILAPIVTMLCQAQTEGLLRGNPVPQRTLYWALFRHVVHLQAAADSQGAAGEIQKENDLLLYYRQKAALTSSEDSLLKQVARECTDQVRQNDNKAKALIQSVRTQYPDGRLSDRSALPPVPVDLLSLQQTRNKIIDDHISRLQSSFGDQEFQRFDKFVKAHVAPQVSRVPLIPAHPEQMRTTDYPNRSSR